MYLFLFRGLSVIPFRMGSCVSSKTKSEILSRTAIESSRSNVKTILENSMSNPRLYGAFQIVWAMIGMAFAAVNL